MSYIVNEAVIISYNVPRNDEAVISDRIEDLKDTLPPLQRSLIRGPFITEGIATWIMLPDGGKEGQAVSDAADETRENLLSIVIPIHDVSVLHISYGGTQKETTIIFSTDDIEEEVENEYELELDPGTDVPPEEEG